MSPENNFHPKLSAASQGTGGAGYDHSRVHAAEWVETMTPEGLNPRQAILARTLFETGAVKIEPSPLKISGYGKDAPESLLKVDLSHLYGDKSTKLRLASAMIDSATLIAPFDQSLVASASTATNGISRDVGAFLFLHPIRIDADATEDETEIKGLRKSDPGGKVLLLTDVVRSGDSVLKTGSVLRRNGLRVEDVVAVLDFENGATEELLRAGYDLISVFSARELLAFGLRTGAISRTQYEQVLEREAVIKEFLKNRQAFLSMDE